MIPAPGRNLRRTRAQQASGPDGTTLKRQVEEDAGAFRKFVIQNGISFLPGPEYPAQEAEREKAYRVVLALLDASRLDEAESLARLLKTDFNVDSSLHAAHS